MEQIKWNINKFYTQEESSVKLMDLNEIKNVKEFHKTIPEYKITPLINLEKMSKLLGVHNISIKDESYRFGLNAFKVLGASYAIAKSIAEKLGMEETNLDFNVIQSEIEKQQIQPITFFSATDGNHGKGVAWAANKLHQKAVIYMPKGTTEARLKSIQKEGAQASIEEYNYDDCVRKAALESNKDPNSIVIQDTAWKGYEKIPAYIMQGYGTMAMEADKQFYDINQCPPTHIFIQAGVGSLAGAITGYFVNKYHEKVPKIIIVESLAADCLYKGSVSGEREIVEGSLDTIMAGLACGEPNILSWDILKKYATAFISLPDWAAVKGMKMLAAPLKGDRQIISGESGAAGFAALMCIMTMKELSTLKEKLELNKNSRILLFSTEGDTDPHKFRSYVWE